ncbi:MAG: DUF4442 domain-containing protein [Deltaproteobacteria bacterium]|nr:DUF4442 domain-containing protein [Deltaproteobacteria bacterium]
MSIAAKLMSSNTNVIREAWNRLAPLPGGKRVFSRMAGLLAPYTGTVGARVVELDRDHARVELRDRWSVRNHLNSVHAIALANLAELTGSMTLAYGLPDEARFIVSGLDLEYVKKARGTIVAECDFEVPRDSDKRELQTPGDLRDASGEVVTRATLRALVGPKK